MLVQRLLPVARDRLVTIADDAPLIEAAKLLQSGTDLLVVCNPDGVLTGVITKTDVVGQISHCQGCTCVAAASLAMTRDVFRCSVDDQMQEVWARMKERGLKNVPIADPQGQPLGVLTARDALQLLLQEVEYEELLLRDYVMGIGYH